MNCENIFCVYWSKEGCGIGEISLDIQGRCCDCIYVDIEEEYLRKRRESMLQRYQFEDGEPG